MAALALVAGLLGGCGRAPAAGPLAVGTEPAHASSPKVVGWAVVGAPAQVSLSPGGASLDELRFWVELYGDRVPALDIRDDVALVVVDDGQVQLEAWVSTTDLQQVTARQARLHDRPEPGHTFGFLTAGTEVTVLEEGAYFRITVTAEDVTVEGYLQARDVARLYQPAVVQLAGYSQVTDFGLAYDYAVLTDQLRLFADPGMSRPVNALLHGKPREAFKFEDQLITVVAPRAATSFPRLVLDLWTPDGWDGCSCGSSRESCGLVDPHPDLRDAPFELRMSPSRCDVSRKPERDGGQSWVAAAGTCLWHESVEGPVGMLLARTGLRPPRSCGRAQLTMDGPFAGRGFFVRSD
jgi:hypothetical protein